MQAASKARNMDTEIFAVSAAEADKNIADKNIDVMLLGPQVRFIKGQFEKKLADKNIPLDIINMQDYGKMNGENVLNQALELIK